MKIFVTAKPDSKEEGVEQIDSTHFKVSVKAPPRQGLANYAIARALGDYFNIAPSRVRLVSGFSSRQKVFDLG
ncbi:MAG: DUF167 domain-containing protein [Candidatus Spechtbacterales bacterium]